MTLPRAAECVVIGGGIVGCASAFALRRAGVQAIVLERRPLLASLTTAASLEAFRAQFLEPENIAMMRESIATFERFGEVIGRPGYDIGLHQQGYLFVTAAPDGPEVVGQRVARQRAAGLDDVEALTGDEARRRFPFLDDAVTAATFRQRDGWLSAYEVARGFAEASGAPIHLGVEVTRIRVDGDRAVGVETSAGAIEAPHVVIACGPFSVTMLASAGVALPLVLLRRQRVTLAPDPRIPSWAPMTIDLETGAHWRPDGQGAALGWALAEDPSPPLDHVPVDWAFPAHALDGCARLTPFWRDVAAGLRREQIRISAGQYTVTPDHKPVIGEVRRGLYVNTGYSGHGVMASPAGARLLAEVVTGRASVHPFRAARFEEGEVAPEGLML